MSPVHRWPRILAVLTVVASSAIWYGCADEAVDPLSEPPSLQSGSVDLQSIRDAIAAQERHAEALSRNPGVIGTAVGFLPNGRVGVRIFVTRPDIPNLPAVLDNVPTAREVTGMLVAFSDPTTRARPAPLGYSVGHPAITAGTIGARVVDGQGNTYILSNNHVLANSNGAQVGDATYQPGPFDGGTASDQIGTLFAFQPIDFTGGLNTMDAAIASVSPADVTTATPADDGYGAPSSVIWGDGDADGFFDDEAALLGLPVQKYGRTTGYTSGQITGINAQLTICYEVLYIFCVKPATFVDQLIIEPGGFSGGGDSGSLIVLSDGSNSPVALLFAGNDTQTIANRIDFVLDHFGVAIDGTPPGPPFTDVEVTGVSASPDVVVGSTARVNVTLRNAGNQQITGPFDVILTDETDGVEVGSASVASLAPGTVTTVGIDWNTTGSSIGSHTLTAHHDLTDEDPSNDQASTTVTVSDVPVPVTDLAVTNVAAVSELVQGNIAGVNVTVRNVGDLDVTEPFDVTVFDATDGVEAGRTSVAGLAVGAQTMVTINWNTAGSSLGLHTVVGRHEVPDADASNDADSTTVRVNDESGSSPVTDIAVTGVSAASAVQGDTAPVTVTLENVGNQHVTTAFAVTVVDETDGVTVGTQTVAGLSAGATTSVVIDWNTAERSIGSHTLTASHDLTDENATNDQASTVVTINDPAGPDPVTNIAVTSVTAVSEVQQGSTAGVNVTVRNVGNQDVGTSFAVTVADDTDGATIGSTTVAGLTAGAQTTVTINWNTASASVGSHTLTGSHDFADDDPSDDQASTTVTVTGTGGPAGTDLAVTSVAAVSQLVQGNIAGVNVTVRNEGTEDVSASFLVTVVDATDGVTVGSRSIAGLDVGAQTTVTIDWNTATSSLGLHTLTASHDVADDDPSNDESSTTVRVTDPSGGSPITDVAVTGVSASSVTQGEVTPVTVSVENVGNQDVITPFTVTGTDATDGVTVGSGSAAGLVAGASTTVTIDWNTAGSSIGTHTLTASHDLGDENASNDEASTITTVNDPGGPSPVTDLAVVGVSAVSELVQGNIAGVNVTVRNEGNQAVGAPFTVSVTDATDEVVVGSATVPGLAAGAQTTVTIDWNTAESSIGLHTLVGRQELPDDDPTNDEGSTTVQVNDPGGDPPVTDIAVTGISVASVTQGTVTPITVTLENLGNQDVAGPFNVRVLDFTEGSTLGLETVTDFAAGTQTTVTIDWNTSGSSIGEHIIIADHDLGDDNLLNDQTMTTATVSAPPLPDEIHVGDLAGSVNNDGRTWSGTVMITVHDPTHGAVAGATVVGAWSREAGAATECVTDGGGTCTVSFAGLRKNIPSIGFSVSTVTLDGQTYAPGENHDSDGDSDGTTITVSKP
jgi:hypothetical protein